MLLSNGKQQSKHTPLQGSEVQRLGWDLDAHFDLVPSERDSLADRIS